MDFMNYWSRTATQHIMVRCAYGWGQCSCHTVPGGRAARQNTLNDAPAKVMQWSWRWASSACRGRNAEHETELSSTMKIKSGLLLLFKLTKVSSCIHRGMLAGQVRQHTCIIFSITDPNKSLHCIEIGPIISKQNAVEWYVVFENRPSFSRLRSQLQSREWFTGVSPVSCGHFLYDEVELGIINSSSHLSFSVPPSGFRSLSDLTSMHMSFATSLHEKVLPVFNFTLLKMGP